MTRFGVVAGVDEGNVADVGTDVYWGRGRTSRDCWEAGCVAVGADRLRSAKSGGGSVSYAEFWFGVLSWLREEGGGGVMRCRLEEEGGTSLARRGVEERKREASLLHSIGLC